jgi:hypothetical protein
VRKRSLCEHHGLRREIITGWNKTLERPVQVAVEGILQTFATQEVAQTRRTPARVHFAFLHTRAKPPNAAPFTDLRSVVSCATAARYRMREVVPRANRSTC